jgi:glutaredoxin 3
VPQIWIDGRHIGGSDELHALERAGELDALLETERT